VTHSVSPLRFFRVVPTQPALIVWTFLVVVAIGGIAIARVPSRSARGGGVFCRKPPPPPPPPRPGSATKTSGIVRIVKDLDIDLTGRDVLLVEDIVDSGLTLRWLRRNLLARHCASLEVCALLVKDGLQSEDPDLRYVGFHIPPDFVVGYGLDVDERYRNLPFVAEYAGDLPPE